MDEDIEHVTADDGCRLWTAATGTGPPLVLCHGGPGLWDTLRPVAQSLEDMATVRRWDQRGGGRSARMPPYTLDRFVLDLDLLREHFGHERWVVGGHSWGSTLALAYALQHPERTGALLYISGTGLGSDWRAAYSQERERRLRETQEFARWSELRARQRTADEERELCEITWMTDFADMTFGRTASRELLAEGFLGNYEVNASLSDALDDEQTMIERCTTLQAPTLIVHGACDPRPVSAVASLATALPNARLEIIEAAGHSPWLEQRDAFEAIVRSFVSAIDA